LRRTLDSTDICQSVLANFFVRAALGQFHLSTPEQLVGLLVTMARNKLATQARRPDVVRRDYQALEPGGAAAQELCDSAASPSSQVAGQELLQAVRQRLTPAERVLAEQRALGHSWQEIAATQGGS